jgi:CO/xanthine dehydrogenase Mo-binding subunit
MGFAVGADTEEIADAALRLVKVEFDVREFVLDQKDALADGSPITQPDISPDTNVMDIESTDKGNIEDGFSQADNIIEFDAHRTENTWAGVEAHSSIATWKGDYLEVVSHTQFPNGLIQNWLRDTFAIPLNHFNITTHYSGGSFGSGNNAQVHTLYVAIILAKKTGKTVKTIMDASVSHFWGSGDDQAYVHFKVGYKNNGVVTAVELNSIFAQKFGVPIWNHLWENTRIPNIRSTQTHLRVNRGMADAYRCEQRAGCIVQGILFDKVADALGMDPTDIALVNDGAEGHAMSELSEFRIKYGFPDTDSLKKCIEDGKKAIDWESKWHLPGTKKLENGKMHGIGFVWDHEWNSLAGGANAAIFIKVDGTASIVTQKCDSGPNGETAYCQIAADELGFRYEDVALRPFYDVGYQLMGMASSMNLCTNGWTVRKAARKAKQQILETATTEGHQLDPLGIPAYIAFPGLTPDDLDIKDSVFSRRLIQITKSL